MRQIYKIGLGALAAGGCYLIYRKFFTRKGNISTDTDISPNGLKHLIHAEGKRNKAYKDTEGLWTIGVGHLIDLVKEKNLLTTTLTDKQVQDLFNKDLNRFENRVKKTITVPLTAYQRDALIMLSFNIGEAAFKNSSLAKLINAKAGKNKIAKAFALWKKPAEIKGRRAKEIRLYLTGNYSPLITSAEVNKYFA